MRRAPLLLVALVVAGCVTQPAAPALDANATAAPPTVNATIELPPMGERLPRAVETFVLTADRTLADQGAGAAKVAVGNTPRALVTTETSFPLESWATPPFARPFELADGSELTLTISSDAPAPGGKDAVQVPSNVVAWVGSPGRWAVFVPFPDAPPALEAGKVYTLKGKVGAAGLFFREGEVLTVTPTVLYETTGAMAWTVGDANLSALRLDHQHFNVSAPVATVVLDEQVAYQCGPAAGPLEHPFSLPEGTVYVVVELAATSAVPGRLDVDFRVLSGGEVVGSAHGPFATETIVIGPTLLAKGRDLKTTMPCPPPSGTYTMKATAYGPAAS